MKHKQQTNKLSLLSDIQKPHKVTAVLFADCRIPYTSNDFGNVTGGQHNGPEARVHPVSHIFLLHVGTWNQKFRSTLNTFINKLSMQQVQQVTLNPAGKEIPGS